MVTLSGRWCSLADAGWSLHQKIVLSAALGGTQGEEPGILPWPKWPCDPEQVSGLS